MTATSGTPDDQAPPPPADGQDAQLVSLGGPVGAALDLAYVREAAAATARYHAARVPSRLATTLAATDEHVVAYYLCTRDVPALLAAVQWLETECARLREDA